jgi:hypothetical protein
MFALMVVERISEIAAIAAIWPIKDDRRRSIQQHHSSVCSGLFTQRERVSGINKED